MIRSLSVLVLCAVVFAIGIFVRSALPTRAADPSPLMAQVLHVQDTLAAPLPSVDIRGEAHRRFTFLQTPATTIFVEQVGDGTKHPAPANIFAYVVSGTGRVELDNAVSDVKAGDLVEIPKGTMHNFASGAQMLKMLVFVVPT